MVTFSEVGNHMSHADKVEVMDFLISVLKDHEKNLDTLITRAEGVLEENQVPANNINNTPNLKISLRNWDDFCGHALNADLICFDLIDSRFYCNAITDTRIYQYSEKTPDVTIELKEDKNNLILSGVKIGNIKDSASLLNAQLSIGLELNARKFSPSKNRANHVIQFDLDIEYTKNWLSKELEIHKDFIIQGSLDT
jgi:hypothetical protein